MVALQLEEQTTLEGIVLCQPARPQAAPSACTYLSQLICLPGVGILQDLALRVGPLQLSLQALDLFLQPWAATPTLALLAVGQLLLQLLHLHGVCTGDCRQLL